MVAKVFSCAEETMKKLLILSASVASMSASMAAAGGMEVGRFSPAFMFESGNFAELSITRTTPKVTDDTFAPKKCAQKVDVGRNDQHIHVVENGNE